LQKLCHAHVQGPRNADKSKKRRIVVASLDPPYIAAIYISHEGQLFLRNSLGQASLADRVSKRKEGRVLAFSGGVWHPRMVSL
jgi:hypothetical protein